MYKFEGLHLKPSIFGWFHFDIFSQMNWVPVAASSFEWALLHRPHSKALLIPVCFNTEDVCS